MPPLGARSGDLDIVSHSAAQTQRIGMRLGALCEGGEVFLLEGDLGAGKTVVAKGIAEGLGVAASVTSPTFSIIHEYAGRYRVAHVDLYRLDGADTVIGTGIEDYLQGDGVTIVEWPSRAPGIFDGDRVVLTLRHVAETKRGICLSPHGPRSRELVARFAREAYGTQA